MRIFRLQTLLTVGLAAKALALVLALVLAWPLLWPAEVTPVQAQEKKQPPAGEQPAPQKKAEPKDAAEKPAADQKQAAEGEAADQEAAAEKPAEPSFDPRVLALIEQEKEQVALEKERLAREREDLLKLRKEVDARIAELKKVQDALAKLVAAERKKRRQRVLQLVKVLSNMRPPSAAAVIEKLDDQMAVEIFSLMQSRIAGKVMAQIKPDKAARISVLLARRKETQKAAALARQAAGPEAQAGGGGGQPAQGQ